MKSPCKIEFAHLSERDFFIISYRFLFFFTLLGFMPKSNGELSIQAWKGYQAVEAFKQSAAEYFEALKLDGALLPGLVVPEAGGTSP